jgi:hypothetical protein
MKKSTLEDFSVFRRNLSTPTNLSAKKRWIHSRSSFVSRPDLRTPEQGEEAKPCERPQDFQATALGLKKR